MRSNLPCLFVRGVTADTDITSDLLDLDLRDVQMIRQRSEGVSGCQANKPAQHAIE
ncbi:Uncharacterized protein DAT39_004203 [Clarias magur]|uniref:Uncharacterized protein n=1 Tax=Clarias magur TaxID=1594786 RepID=A0A8J4X8S8_CLAMG|nr:Uncharacterized protein DAT39_004203 [Clarias magur]